MLRLAGTLFGTLSDDGLQIGGLVSEIEGRLSGGSLDEAPVVLERQSTLPTHPLYVSGFRIRFSRD